MRISTAAGGIITGLSTKAGGIVAVVNGILCIPQILSPSGLKNLTANILNMLDRYAAGVITGLTNFVVDTITRNIQNVTGVIGSQINAINNFLRDIRETITFIKTFIKSLKGQSKGVMDFLFDKENCDFAAAELAKCLISDILDEVPKAITKQLSDGTSDLNNKVLDVTEKLLLPEKSITRYVYQTQMFANKASIQQMF